MDKYTVDLDQVLNDFEYSELTEQSENQQQSNVASSIDPQYKNTTVKHSINNVFTSLNEYLNTEINKKTDNNKTETNCTVSYDYSLTENVPNIENCSINTNHVSINSKNIKDEIDKPIQVVQNLIDDLEVGEKPECQVNNVNVDSINDETKVLEFSPNNLIINNDISKDNEITNDQEDKLTLETEELNNVIVGDKENLPKIEVIEDTIVDENIVIENLDDRKLCDESRDINKPNVQEAIGFDSTLDIDEEELNKYLENLEEELEMTKSKPDDSDIQHVSNIAEKNIDSIQCNSLARSSSEDSYKSSELNVDFVNHNVDVCIKDEVATVEPEIKIEDCKNIEVINPIIIIESDNKIESESTINIDSTNNGQSDQSNDVSQSVRPTKLDFQDKIETKREISLIGNPGSTPYNNIYVSKEIPVDQSKVVGNYESESSTSVSPTFSEASTDSVRSSDSIDSENEHNAENNEINEAAGVSSVANNNNDKTDEDKEAGTYKNEESKCEVTVAEEGVKNPIQVQNNDPDVPVCEALKDILEDELWIGRRAPVWIADSDALNCMHCDFKFTVIKRRHHCRACGLVLCSKCCNLKHRLEYLDTEARICTKCHEIITRDVESSSGSEASPAIGNSPMIQGQPNPNNPMEYCSVVPPLQQVGSSGENPPSVMVPVGVLKRKGSNKTKHNKSVMFCDGIRPGSDLTNLDNDFNYNDAKPAVASAKKVQPVPKVNRNIPILDAKTKSFIPENESCLPPTVTRCKTDVTYTDCANNANVVEMLKNETLSFALQRNLTIHVRLISMSCCINRQGWCFSTEGLINVGQDEIIILLEYIDNEKLVPKDIFYHLNNIYHDAVKGTTVSEHGISLHPTTNFLESKNHAGFIYIRPTYQCFQNVIIPKEPYLIGVLVHRWETPWAKIFPLRLVLRLGAEYKYYPSPIISTRHRDSVFVEIGHTIINLLADFRNFSYTLPNIRGLQILMEEKNTTVTIPVNRYDQVMKSLSNSSDHILAFGGNFCSAADTHLVCIQDTQGNNENNYTTHAINIQNKPRKVTGASFIVFNGALKSTSGLTAKSSIVEDGLMIQIPAEHMLQIREDLRNMKNHTINCGYINAPSDETVNIVWGEPDINFNIGVKSSVDDKLLSGIPSIRVHNGKDYFCNSGSRLIRWTEVFLIENGEENARNQDTVDISKVAEGIAKATCQALVKYLDLLAANNFFKIGLRTNLHVENVSYSAGSNGIKLPPIYMKRIDNELIPVLHRITTNNLGDSTFEIELIFRILNV